MSRFVLVTTSGLLQGALTNRHETAELLMARLTEAALIISGTIMDIQERKDFETQKFAGLDVAIGTGNGFAVVRLDVDQAREAAPVLMSRVNYKGRAGAWAGDRGNADVRYRFLGLATESDLDMLVSNFGAAAAEPVTV